MGINGDFMGYLMGYLGFDLEQLLAFMMVHNGASQCSYDVTLNGKRLHNNGTILNGKTYELSMAMASIAR